MHKQKIKEQKRNLDKNDFNKVAHKWFKKNWSNTDLENIIFTNEVIGRGSLGVVYFAIDHKQDSYALKVFHPIENYSNEPKKKKLVLELRNLIEQNIQTQKELFSQEPFAKLRAVPYAKKSELINCYLMDFSKKEKSYESIPSDENFPLVALTYAKMLEKIHKEEKIFIDNSWSCVISEKEKETICDYEFITPIGIAQEIEYFPYHAQYGSREHYLQKTEHHIPLNKSSDLESFALMIDKAITGTDLIDHGTMHWKINKRKAIKNKRDYPNEHKIELPKRLGEIIPKILTYPRDNSITATDFVSAIKQDYGI